MRKRLVHGIIDYIYTADCILESRGFGGEAGLGAAKS